MQCKVLLHYHNIGDSGVHVRLNIQGKGKLVSEYAFDIFFLKKNRSLEHRLSLACSVAKGAEG